MMKVILLLKEGGLIHAIFFHLDGQVMRIYGLGLFTQKGSSRTYQCGRLSIFYWCSLPAPDKIIDGSDVSGIGGQKRHKWLN